MPVGGPEADELLGTLPALPAEAGVDDAEEIDDGRRIASFAGALLHLALLGALAHSLQTPITSARKRPHLELYGISCEAT